MSVDLKKKIINLSKTAKIEIDKLGLDGVNSRVVLVLDISRSMNKMYKDGTVQEIVERSLALTLNFTDKIDVILFGTKSYQLPSVGLKDLDGYIEREVLSKYSVNEATMYSKAIELIEKVYRLSLLKRILNYFKKIKPEPVFVIFITDGNNMDKKSTTSIIKKISKRAIFFQFIGIGKETFSYLKKLDTLTGRFIDNAGFAPIEDIKRISDSDLYSLLLKEYPEWIKEAKNKELI